jgi:hypothetical protein
MFEPGLNPTGHIITYSVLHGLRTPNDSINQRNLKNWADEADKNILRPYLKIWDWDLIFGRAVKVISSLGVRSPWCVVTAATKFVLSS